MMVQRPVLVVFLLAQLALVPVLAADDFKCFQCSSDRDDGCWDPTGEGMEPQECDSVEHQAKIFFQKTKNVFKDLFSSIISKGSAPNNENFHYACLKTISIVQGTKVVRRKCTLDTSEVVDDEGVAVENECSSKSANSVCEICKTDSCNSAPGQAAQAIGLLAASGLLILKLLL